MIDVERAEKERGQSCESLVQETDPVSRQDGKPYMRQLLGVRIPFKRMWNLALE